MTQYALPVSDGSVGTAPPVIVTGSVGTRFDDLDEGFGVGRGSGSGPDDTTTSWRTGEGDGEAATFMDHVIGALTDPAGNTGHVVRVRWIKCTSDGTPSSAGVQADGYVVLMEGATPIASATATALSNSWVTTALTLAGAEADAISAYSALTVRVYHDRVGAGTARFIRVSALEMEVPDAPVALSATVGQASETDTAQAIAWAPKHRLVAQAIETDTAQEVSAPGAADAETRQFLTMLIGG